MLFTVFANKNKVKKKKFPRNQTLGCKLKCLKKKHSTEDQENLIEGAMKEDAAL